MLRAKIAFLGMVSATVYRSYGQKIKEHRVFLLIAAKEPTENCVTAKQK